VCVFLRIRGLGVFKIVILKTGFFSVLSSFWEGFGVGFKKRETVGIIDEDIEIEKI